MTAEHAHHTPPHQSGAWTDAETEIAARMWREGKSATEIGDSFNPKRTRNSVISRMRRSGVLTPNTQPSRHHGPQPARTIADFAEHRRQLDAARNARRREARAAKREERAPEREARNAYRDARTDAREKRAPLPAASVPKPRLTQAKIADRLKAQWRDPVWRERQREKITAGLLTSERNALRVMRDTPQPWRPAPWHPLHDNQRLLAKLGMRSRTPITAD